MSANSPFHTAATPAALGGAPSSGAGFRAWACPARSLHLHEGTPSYGWSEAMLDVSVPLWDLRPNPRLPSLEIGAMDVMADVDDTVALAVLIRALVARRPRVGAATQVTSRRQRYYGRRTGGQHVMGGRAVASRRADRPDLLHPNPGLATRRPRKACPAGPPTTQ